MAAAPSPAAHVGAPPVAAPARPAGRPNLRVVPSAPRRTGPFVATLGILAALAVFGVVTLHALAAQAAFRASELDQEVVELELRQDELMAEVARLEAPDRIRQVAAARGMVAAEQPDYLVLDDRRLFDRAVDARMAAVGVDRAGQ